MNAEIRLESGLLDRAGFRHAFFTRRGGVSSGPYESLSFSQAVGDTAKNVAENLSRAAATLEIAPERIYFLSQVHGANVVTLDGSEARERVLEREGDAVVSGRSDLACGVRVADCVPILVADCRSGAVAAIHAGWRGIVAGVIASALDELGRVAGGPIDPIAAIGPHISVGAFEVSEDVAEELRKASPDPGVVERSWGERPHVDLRRLVRALLIRAGVPENRLDDVPGCTVGDPTRFFSYRRDGQRSGRHLAAIVARA